MGGEIITFIRESLSIFSKLMVEKGISLGARSNLFCSFKATEATRVTKLSEIPYATFANVFMLQGIIAVASTLE